jgi:hypothetical protein
VISTRAAQAARAKVLVPECLECVFFFLRFAGEREATPARFPLLSPQRFGPPTRPGWPRARVDGRAPMLSLSGAERPVRRPTASRAEQSAYARRGARVSLNGCACAASWLGTDRSAASEWVVVSP